MQLQRQVTSPSSLRRVVVPPALALLAVVGIAASARIVRCRAGMTRTDIATLAVKDYVAEAFPGWRADHPGRACPTSLAELSPYLNSRDTRDPWGEPYRFACGAARLFVVSSGEDGKLGTEDDIRSDR